MREGDTLALEKQKRLNNAAMAAGFAMVAAGIAVYFLLSVLGGVLLAIAGITVLMITLRVADVFFKMKMIESQEERKK